MNSFRSSRLPQPVVTTSVADSECRMLGNLRAHRREVENPEKLEPIQGPSNQKAIPGTHADNVLSENHPTEDGSQTRSAKTIPVSQKTSENAIAGIAVPREEAMTAYVSSKTTIESQRHAADKRQCFKASKTR